MNVASVKKILLAGNVPFEKPVMQRNFQVNKASAENYEPESRMDKCQTKKITSYAIKRSLS